MKKRKLRMFLVRLVEITAIGAIALGISIVGVFVKVAAWCEAFEERSLAKNGRKKNVRQLPLRISDAEFPRAPEDPLPLPRCRVIVSKD